MTEHTIERGLRKLEFISVGDESETRAEARVEFACETPLPDGATVRISLGMRSGKLRWLVGVPQRMETQPSSGARDEYLYRLSGEIIERAT